MAKVWVKKGVLILSDRKCMKKILVLLFIAVIFAACGKDENSPYLYEVRIFENIYKYGQPSHEEMYEKYTYDENGKLMVKFTNHYYYQSESRYSEYIYYKYDGKNRKVEEKTSDRRIEFTYNDIDSVSEEKIYSELGLSDIVRYTYNDKRQLIRKDEVPVILSVGYYSLYSYVDNLLVRVDTYKTEDNSLFWSYTYEYDSKGNITKRISLESGERETSIDTYTYRYNADGSIAQKEVASTYPLGEQCIYSYEYNEDKSIKKVHLKFTNKPEERERTYYYVYSNEE